MPPKKKPATPKLSTPIDSVKHKDKRANNHGGFGRWKFLEIVDPWDAKNTIHAFLQGQNVDGIGPLLRG